MARGPFDAVFAEFSRGMVNRYPPDHLGSKAFQIATNVVFRDEQAQAVDKAVYYTDLPETVTTLYGAAPIAVTSIFKSRAILGFTEIGNAYATFLESNNIVYFTAPSLTYPTKTKDNVNFYKLGITAPSVAPAATVSGAGSCVASDEQFGYSYYSSTFDHESIMSPLSAAITLASNAAFVTVTAHATANEHVDKIYTYLSLASSGIFYKVKESANATGGITISQAYSSALPVFDGEKNELPPQLEGIVGPYNGSLFGWTGRYLYGTVATQYNGWPSTGYTWEFPLPIVGARLIRNIGIMVWTDYQTYLFSGPTVERMAYQPLSQTVGLAFSHAVCMTDFGMAWLSNNGVALYDGTGIRLITPPILSDTWFAANIAYGGANIFFGWVDQQLVIFNHAAAKATIIDFFRYPTLCVTQTDYAANATGVGISQSANGLWFVRNDSGDHKIYEWAKSGGTDQVMVIKTGEVKASSVGRMLKPRRIMLDYIGGPFAFDLYANDVKVDTITAPPHTDRGDPYIQPLVAGVYAARLSARVTGIGTVYAIGILDIDETEGWK